MRKHCTIQNDAVVFFTKCKMKHFFVELQKEEDEAICKDHSLSLGFYCTICKEVICMDCFLLLHKQHKARTMKYARDLALHAVEIIESVRSTNAARYDRIQQKALQIQKNLEICERDIIMQIEEMETKIQGLISSILKKTKLHSKSILWETKQMVEATLNNCEKSRNCNELSLKLKEIGDLQLACMLKDLSTAREEDEKETVRIDDMVQTLHRTRDAPILVANEKAIFTSMLDLFKHITFDQSKYGRSIPHDLTFEGFKNGDYVVKMVEEESNDTACSPVDQQKGM